jgi:hypothetical protein
MEGEESRQRSPIVVTPAPAGRDREIAYAQ